MAISLDPSSLFLQASTFNSQLISAHQTAQTHDKQRSETDTRTVSFSDGIALKNVQQEQQSVQDRKQQLNDQQRDIRLEISRLEQKEAKLASQKRALESDQAPGSQIDLLV